MGGEVKAQEVVDQPKDNPAEPKMDKAFNIGGTDTGATEMGTPKKDEKKDDKDKKKGGKVEDGPVHEQGSQIQEEDIKKNIEDQGFKRGDGKNVPKVQNDNLMAKARAREKKEGLAWIPGALHEAFTEVTSDAKNTVTTTTYRVICNNEKGQYVYGTKTEVKPLRNAEEQKAVKKEEEERKVAEIDADAEKLIAERIDGTVYDVKPNAKAAKFSAEWLAAQVRGLNRVGDYSNFDYQNPEKDKQDPTKYKYPKVRVVGVYLGSGKAYYYGNAKG
jgi:hypothetical protein